MGQSVLKLEWLDRNPQEAFEDIRDCSILNYFPEDFLDILSTFGETRMLQEGELVLSEGDVNSELFFLLSGAVEILIDEQTKYQMSEVGEVFGEMSLIAEAPCAATVRACEDSCVLVFSHQEIVDIVEQNPEDFGFVLYQVFSKILTKRLADANQKTQLIEEKNRELSRLSREIEMVAHERFKELWGQGNMTYDHLEKVYTSEICALTERMRSEEEFSSEEAFARLEKIERSLKPIFEMYEMDRKVHQKRVLLAERDKQYQRFVKTALVGAGVQLQVVEDKEEAFKVLNNEHFDFLLVSPQLMAISEIAHSINPDMKHVLMASGESASYSHYFQSHPYLSNIVSLNENARVFTLKNVFTTLGKLTSGDIFGMEKYLNWGVDIKKHTVHGSEQRKDVLSEMEKNFAKGGLRGTVINHCRGVAEELLMNAIYAAPTEGQSDEPKYNHLSRKEEVELEDYEKSQFSYACDGVMAAISIQDPFGSLDKNTIMTYLHKDQVREDSHKAGAGVGLRMVLEQSDLVVFNIKKGVRTEIISFFNMDHKVKKSFEAPVFHLFYED